METALLDNGWYENLLTGFETLLVSFKQNLAEQSRRENYHLLTG